MPTAPKLVAALLLALTAVLAAYAYSLGFPTKSFKGNYYLMSAGLGFLVGWYTLGQRPYFGGLDSVVAGVRANIILAMVAAISFALVSVWNGMGDHAFNNPFQVPITWITRSIAYFVSGLTIEVWAILLLAGAVAGRLTGVANYHWR
jgi:hypothetical protein